jgi:hypothetical protein
MNELPKVDMSIVQLDKYNYDLTIREHHIGVLTKGELRHIIQQLDQIATL